jgi:hypothetical protein
MLVPLWRHQIDPIVEAGFQVAVGKGRSIGQRRGGMSAAARKRLSEMMKKRWAERRRKAKSS